MNIEISPKDKLFDLQEAQELLPTVMNITNIHVQNINPLQNKLDRLLSNDPRRASLERIFEIEISAWRGKVRRLGASAIGLWVVEFNVGTGCLNWRYPELKIGFFRPQNSRIRKKLDDYIEENDPDWAI